MKYLKFLTLLPQEEIEELTEKAETEPEKRETRRRLTEEATRSMHNEEDLEEAQKITQTLFSGNIRELNAEEIAQGFSKVPNVEASSTSENIVELLISTKIEPSKRQVRENVSNGAININDDHVTDLNFVINLSDEFDGKFVVIREDEKNYFLARVVGQDLVSFCLEKEEYYYNIPILKPILRQNVGCR